MTCNEKKFQEIAKEQFQLSLCEQEIRDWNINDSVTEDQMYMSLSLCKAEIPLFQDDEDFDEEYEIWKQEAGY